MPLRRVLVLKTGGSLSAHPAKRLVTRCVPRMAAPLTSASAKGGTLDTNVDFRPSGRLVMRLEELLPGGVSDAICG